VKLDLIHLDAEEERRAWSMLPRHLIQSTLHNELVRKIESLRDDMEKAGEPHKILESQAAIKAHRFLLGLIHRNDKLPTR
jgi:hypothetical protein